MTISTSGFYQKNIDLFSRLNNEVSDLQVQVSTGKKSLSLKHDVKDISLLNASEDHKVEIIQFKSNAEQIVSDLEKISQYTRDTGGEGQEGRVCDLPPRRRCTLSGPGARCICPYSRCCPSGSTTGACQTLS